MSRKRSFFAKGQKQQAESWIEEIRVFTGKQHRLDWDRFSSFGETQKFIKSLEREIRQLRKKSKGITYNDLKKTTLEFRKFVSKIENEYVSLNEGNRRVSLKTLERSSTSGFIKELLGESSNVTMSKMLEILQDKKKSKALRKFMSEYDISARKGEMFNLQNAYNREILDQYFSRMRGDSRLKKLDELIDKSKNPSRALAMLVEKISSLEFKEEWDSSQKSMGVPTDEVMDSRLGRAVEYMESYLASEKRQKPVPKGAKVIKLF